MLSYGLDIFFQQKKYAGFCNVFFYIKRLDIAGPCKLIFQLIFDTKYLKNTQTF